MRITLTSAALLALAVQAFAVDGIVLNGTTKQPQPGVDLNLVQPSEKGMVPLGKAKSGPDGKFVINAEIPPGPGLLQATYQGATYNQILTPVSPKTGVEVMVYDSTNKVGTAKASEHMILLEPDETALRVTEMFILKNDTSLTFNDPQKGSVQYYLPKDAKDAKASITAPGGMPITRPPAKTGQADVYKVDYPVKPGETRFDITYTVPPAQKFAGKVLPSDSATHMVTPSTVTITGNGIEPVGQEPQTKAHLYNLSGLDYNVLIEGTGSMRGPAEGQPEEDNGSPKVEVAPARIYSRVWWVLGLAFAILALGGTMLFRRGDA
ncbi:MAG: hypothetical protein ABL995_14750 [Bryobacteraceae bacterium]